MKSNVIKYIFILFVIGIIGFAVYKIYYKKDTTTENEIANEISTKTEVLTNMRLRNCKF